MHDDVGLSRQCDAAEHCSAVAIQRNQCSAIGRAEKTIARNRQAMWPSSWDVESPCDLEVLRTEHDDLSWLLNVRVDVLGDSVINSPTRSTGKRDGRDHPQLVNRDHGNRAVHARRIADVENKKTPPRRIVRQPIGTITDRNAAEQHFVRAAIDTHPRTATIGREKEVLLAIDQNTGDAWHIWQGTQIAICVTVDNVNAIGARMSDIQARHYR